MINKESYKYDMKALSTFLYYDLNNHKFLASHEYFQIANDQF